MEKQESSFNSRSMVARPAWASVEQALMPVQKLVSIVDDDVSFREAMPDLLRYFGFDVAPFNSAEAFLASGNLDRTGCLILDVSMPGMTGPALQTELIRRKVDIPIVFITARSDDQMIPDLLSRGAIACICKPLSEIALIEAVNAAFARAKGG